MRREPKESELEMITEAARRGDRLTAISLYISATEAGLTEAQDFVRSLGGGEKSERPEKGGKKTP